MRGSVPQRANLKSHMLEIAQYPCARGIDTGRINAGDRARIDQQSMPPLDIGLLDNFGDVAVAAADEIVISGAGHGMAVMGIMRHKNTPPGKFQHGIQAVIDELPGRFCHQLLHGHWVADIVAMHDMQRQAEFDRSAQGLGSDQVAAMDNCLRAISLCGSYRRSKRFGTVMTVGGDTYFHFVLTYSTSIRRFIVNEMSAIKFTVLSAIGRVDVYSLIGGNDIPQMGDMLVIFGSFHNCSILLRIILRI